MGKRFYVATLGCRTNQADSAAIRQEFLDHTLFWNAVDLERKLALFKDYYNHSRTHASLDGNTPAEISGDSVAQPAPLNSYAWEKHCGGPFQLPVAA